MQRTCHCVLVGLAALVLLSGCVRTVPDVVGMQRAAAEAALAAAGFDAAFSIRCDATVAEGVVIAQDPAGGLRRPGRAITVVVSGGAGEAAALGRGPVLQTVPAGTFAMGDPWAEFDYDERPVHDVTLSAYRIGTYEVTNAEFAGVLNWALDQGLITGDADSVSYNEQELLDLDSIYCQISYVDGAYVTERWPDHDMEYRSMADNPVVAVSWYGAVAYCNWLSEASQVIPCYDLLTWTLDAPTAGGYRLPSEAEWERAAGWSADTARHWRYCTTSDTLKAGQACFDYANPLGLRSEPYTGPVGHYAGQTSPVGCCDMSGNVQEWVHDWYYTFYYFACGEVTIDPFGPLEGTARVARGGDWRCGTRDCRSAFRYLFAPDDRNYMCGFRVARSGD